MHIALPDLLATRKGRLAAFFLAAGSCRSTARPRTRPHSSTVLVFTFWAACIVYNVFQGLYYGIRTALYMDITNPAVAATQFTAYMALLNLCISYTSTWQGAVVERIGYPMTLVLDCAFGMSALVLLPLMRPARRAPAAKPDRTTAAEAAAA